MKLSHTRAALPARTIVKLPLLIFSLLLAMLAPRVVFGQG